MITLRIANLNYPLTNNNSIF